MESPGAVIVCGFPSAARAEFGRVTFTLPLEIYENPKINRAAGGTLKTAAEIAENIWGILEGYTYSGYPQFTPLRPQRLAQVYADEGLIIYAVDVETTTAIKQTSY
jgi:hypothetical protein